jgi:hypothetical protein
LGGLSKDVQVPRVNCGGVSRHVIAEKATQLVEYEDEMRKENTKIITREITGVLRDVEIVWYIESYIAKPSGGTTGSSQRLENRNERTRDRQDIWFVDVVDHL